MNSGKYHHGDLRNALLTAAGELLRSDGVEGLSLRRLAERAGVSRTAPYHHFADKNALLCALAVEGFAELERLIGDAQEHPEQPIEKRLGQFVSAYLDFATRAPEQYELMFGRSIWKTGEPSAELKEVAHGSFRGYADWVATLCGARLPDGVKPLRLAQASWATLHGLCRLLIDGIYVDQADIEEVSEEAVRLMLAALS